MRNHKDTKAMAKSLRASLAARSVLLSHGECLEIVAKQFGFADWNTLSAKLGVVSCSFCGKSQHEVQRLIEGGCSSQGMSPCAFICDACVALCAQIDSETTGALS